MQKVKKTKNTSEKGKGGKVKVAHLYLFYALAAAGRGKYLIKKIKSEKGLKEEVRLLPSLA